MNFQEFQESRLQLEAKYDENNILKGIGDLSLESSGTEQWCWVDGIDYYPCEDLSSVSFYAEMGLYIEELSDGTCLLNIENGSIVTGREHFRKLELALYNFACEKCFCKEEFLEIESVRSFMIEQCQKIDPNGTYRDFDSIRKGLPPMTLFEVCRKFAELAVEKGAEK